MKECLACGTEFSGDAWYCPSCHQVPPVIGGYPAFAPDQSCADDCFDRKYFGQLAGLEEGNWWFRSRNRLLIKVVGRFFPHFEKFLEIGCGTGFVLSGIRDCFPDVFLSGSEIFSEGLFYAAGRLPGVTLFQMDGRRIPFSEEFDVIGAFDVLEHVEEDRVVLKQIFKALRKGGGIMLTVPQHRWLWSAFDELSFHKRRYTRRELAEKVESSGFRVIRITSFFTLVFPLMIIARLRRHSEKTSTKDYNLLEEFSLPSGINALLEKTCDLERLMLMRGISPPFGGSLLCVGMKD